MTHISRLADGPVIPAITQRAKELGTDFIFAQGAPAQGPDQRVLDAVADAARKGEGLSAYPSDALVKQVKEAFLNAFNQFGDMGVAAGNIIICGYGRDGLATGMNGARRYYKEQHPTKIAACDQSIWPNVLGIADDYAFDTIKIKFSGNHGYTPAAKDILDFFPTEETEVGPVPDTGVVILYWNEIANNHSGLMTGIEEIKDILRTLHGVNEARAREGYGPVILELDSPYSNTMPADYPKTMFAVAKQLLDEEGIDVRSYMMESLSGSKVERLHGIGVSALIVGDDKMAKAIGAHQLRAKNHPGVLSLIAFREALNLITPEYLEADRAYFAERRELITQGLQMMGADVLVPEAGMFVNVKIGHLLGMQAFIGDEAFEIRTAKDLCEWLLEEHKVAVVPNTDGTIRIFAGMENKDILAKGIQALGKALKVAGQLPKLESAPGVRL